MPLTHVADQAADASRSDPVARRIGLLMRALRELGFPAVLVFVLLFGGWQTVERVGYPLVEAHQQFLDRTATTMERYADGLDRIESVVRVQTENQARIIAGQERLLQAQEDVIDLLSRRD